MVTPTEKYKRWAAGEAKRLKNILGIREELNTFTTGMFKKMKTKLNFVNIAGGVYHDITNNVVNTPYNINPMFAAAT